MRKQSSLAMLLVFPANLALGQDSDATLGRVVFNKCLPCHTATTANNKVGPSLMGVVGRPVASVANYNYSSAMKAFGADGKVWSEATLSTYLEAPRTVVSGTKMIFPGLKDLEDRAHVIAYLKDPAAAQ